MTDLEKTKIELEFKRVELAKSEMQYKILERLDEIERLKENIKIQDNRLEQLTKQLGE